MAFFVGLYSLLRSRRRENLQTSKRSTVYHEDRFNNTRMWQIL